jgi:hypothetical protein
MKRLSKRTAGRFAFNALAFGLAVALFGAFAHHVYRFEMKPLAALGVPILLAFFGFASLLFIRGRSLAKGRAQFRSLYAAERAVQAAVWHLSAILVGATIYALLVRFGLRFDPLEPSAASLWLLLFLAPYALMQIGVLAFLRAVWAVAPQFLRGVGAFELRRRVEQ